MTDSTDFDELFRINCGKCQRSSPMLDWTRTKFGDLPRNHFQCPQCGYAFQRKLHEPKDRNPTVYGTGKHTWVCYPSGHITLDAVQPFLA